MALHAVVRGDPSGAPPLVLLHGFGGTAEAWRAIIDRQPAGRPVIAYDLPGHGRSIDAHGIGHAGDMATVILADLQARGIGRFHPAGHSMGGAIAALLAIRAQGRVASLTLLAPGGLKPEINHRALRRYGAAATAAELRLAMEPMLGFNGHFPEDALAALAEARQLPGAIEALSRVLERILVEAGPAMQQGTLPLDRLRALDMPIELVWGLEDMILPVAQAECLSGRVMPLLLGGVGHMLVEEAPNAVLDVIGRNLGAA